MANDDFAVVSYLPGKLGSFVDALRGRFDPALAAWLAHVTILPPRPLEAPMDSPLEAIQSACALVEPFEISLGGVSTFWPTSGVVYLSFSAGADRLIALHNTLNSGPLACHEVHSYVPHVTIAQELDERGKETVLAQVSQEWSRYAEKAPYEVDSLILVQKTTENRWLDLASIRLGSRVARSRR